MSTIQSTQTQDDLFSSLGLTRQTDAEGGGNDPGELGLNTFLKLMVTQMNNQDPFKPMENGDFLGQIAQFGSVTGLEKLNTQIADLGASLTSGQALQAGSLVGHEVLVNMDVGRLQTGQSIRGQVELENSSSDLTLRVYDQVGQLVREIPLGSAQAGTQSFAWDGTDNGGSYVPPGFYKVRVSAQQGDESVDLQTQMIADVESVSVSGTQGLTLNLAGLGSVAFADVQQIH